MECQDCNKREGRFLVYDYKKEGFFIVCRDCIKGTDKVCPYELIKELMSDGFLGIKD